jgi:hypothetical protein
MGDWRYICSSTHACPLHKWRWVVNLEHRPLNPLPREKSPLLLGRSLVGPNCRFGGTGTTACRVKQRIQHHFYELSVLVWFILWLTLGERKPGMAKGKAFMKHGMGECAWDRDRLDVIRDWTLLFVYHSHVYNLHFVWQNEAIDTAVGSEWKHL